MAISPDYREIQQAVSELGTHNITDTDLDALKDKIVTFIETHGISDIQLTELTGGFERAVKKLEGASSSTAAQTRVKQLKEFPEALKRVAEQAGFVIIDVEKQEPMPSKKEMDSLLKLAEKLMTDSSVPAHIKPIVESFTTEASFVKQMRDLNTLFNDPDFIDILEDKKVGDEALGKLTITGLGNFQPMIRASEKMLLGLYKIVSMIQQKSYDDATRAYIQLMDAEYEQYAQVLADRTQAYQVVSAHLTKLQDSTKIFRQEAPAKGRELLGRETIANIAITPMQRGPRHSMLAETIAKKSTSPLKEKLTEIYLKIKTQNKKINEEFGKFEDEMTKTGELQEIVYLTQKRGPNEAIEDPEWQKSLESFGLDQATLQRISSWYDLFGQTIARLQLPIRALEEDPSNKKLRSLVMSELQKLKSELAIAHYDVDKMPTKDVGIENLSHAIERYNETNPEKLLPDFGAKLSERLNLVVGWIKEYLKF